jgi:hypothetical protein
MFGTPLKTWYVSVLAATKMTSPAVVHEFGSLPPMKELFRHFQERIKGAQEPRITCSPHEVLCRLMPR